MHHITIFRVLIIASIAVAIPGTCADFLVPELLPDAIEDAFEAYAATVEPTMLRAIALGSFALVLVVGTVIGTVGLLLFKWWSRPLSLWISALALLSYPVFGPVVYSGWAYMLTEISMTLWGAALAMAYFSEIRVKFERNAVN